METNNLIARAQWVSIALPILIVLGAGIYLFDQEQKETLRSTENTLSAIADLKVQQVLGWRAERISDAEMLSNNPLFAETVDTWLRDKRQRQNEAALRRVLSGYVGTGDVTNAILLDIDGGVLLAGADFPDVPAQTMAIFPAIARDETARLTEPGIDRHGRVMLDAVAPVFDADHRLLAFVVLRIDADTFLFPFIRTWPTPSPSAETLLARRDGDSVLFINETRHARNSGLSLKISLKQATLPAVSAVLGRSTVMHGKDYRGMEVLAATRPLPGTSWGMVSKIDWQEVVAAQRKRLIEITAGTALLTGFAMLMMVMFWRRAFSHAVSLHASERSDLENRLRQIIDVVPHFIFAKDKEGRFILANQALANAYGTKVEKLIGKRDADFNPNKAEVEGFLAADREVIDKRLTKIINKEEVTDIKGQQRLLQTTKMPLVLANEECAVLGVSTDITELIASEEQLRLMAKIFEYSHEAFLVSDANNNIVAINRAFCDLTGYSEAEVIGKNPRILATGQTLRETYLEMWHALDMHGFWQGEIWDKRKDGSVYPKWLSIAVVRDALGEVVNYVAGFPDMTERKQAEAKIHHLAHHDVLTGLPNRLTLELRLEDNIKNAHRNQEQLAVMFIDLDRFKTINDTLGHHVGDPRLRYGGAAGRGRVRGDVAAIGPSIGCCAGSGENHCVRLQALPHEWARTAYQPQHRYRHFSAGWRKCRGADEKCRYGDVSRQSQRPQQFPVFLRRNDSHGKRAHGHGKQPEAGHQSRRICPLLSAAGECEERRRGRHGSAHPLESSDHGTDIAGSVYSHRRRDRLDRTVGHVGVENRLQAIKNLGSGWRE